MDPIPVLDSTEAWRLARAAAESAGRDPARVEARRDLCDGHLRLTFFALNEDRSVMLDQLLVTVERHMWGDGYVDPSA